MWCLSLCLHHFCKSALSDFDVTYLGVYWSSSAECKIISYPVWFLQNLTQKTTFRHIHQVYVARIYKWKRVWKIGEEQSYIHLWRIFWPDNCRCRVKNVWNVLGAGHPPPQLICVLYCCCFTLLQQSPDGATGFKRLLVFKRLTLRSKRGAYWDRLCRDVVGRWLSRACTVAKRCIMILGL